MSTASLIPGIGSLGVTRIGHLNHGSLHAERRIWTALGHLSRDESHHYVYDFANLTRRGNSFVCSNDYAFLCLVGLFRAPSRHVACSPCPLDVGIPQFRGGRRHTCAWHAFTFGSIAFFASSIASAADAAVDAAPRRRTLPPPVPPAPRPAPHPARRALLNHTERRRRTATVTAPRRRILPSGSKFAPRESSQLSAAHNPHSASSFYLGANVFTSPPPPPPAAAPSPAPHVPPLAASPRTRPAGPSGPGPCGGPKAPSLALVRGLPRTFGGAAAVSPLARRLAPPARRPLGRVRPSPSPRFATPAPFSRRPPPRSPVALLRHPAGPPPLGPAAPGRVRPSPSPRFATPAPPARRPLPSIPPATCVRLPPCLHRGSRRPF
eukprot:tig00021687_g23120.t1